MSAPDTTFLRVFALYPLIVIGIITFLVVCWDGICDFFESFCDDFYDRSAKGHSTVPKNHYRSINRRHRRKWRLFLPFLSHRRRKWIAKRNSRHAERKCKDVFAESLATHEEILEAMYDESPSMWKVYRNVRDRYSA